jgi:hypothetical protein
LIASEIFKNFALGYWLAVVGEGAGSAGVVGAGDHGLGSFGCGGCYKLAPAGDCCAVVAMSPLKGVFERQ